MALKEIVTAVQDEEARAQREEEQEKQKIVFLHDGNEVGFFQPTSGQATILLTLMSGDIDMKEMSLIINLFIEMADPDTQRYFEDRLLDRHDTFEFASEGGIMDILEHLVEQWSARPTKRPSDYQPSRRSTGRQSTAPTRAKGSTSSRSRSRDSSASSTSGR